VTYSSACEDLVKHFEGLELTAYRCPAGVWTIGWGHTNGVNEGDQITMPQAEDLITEDLVSTADQLTSLLPSTANLTQGQFDALTSLAFNIGGGARALPQKAPKLWANLLAGDAQCAADQFLDIDHALVNGVPTELPGLKARRQAEASMFLGG
jgi:lysozyme